MEYEQLLQKALQMNAEAQNKENVTATDYAIVEFLLDNCEIIVPEASEFFVRTNVGKDGKRVQRVMKVERVNAIKPTFYTEAHRAGIVNYGYAGYDDFGHTAPVWDSIMRLGLGGLKKRIAERKGPAKNPDFAPGLLRIFDATERFMYRAADAAEAAGKTRMAKGIRNLATNAPSNLFEGFQMTLVFYGLQQFFDATDIRTMGRLDQLLQPFYEREPNKESIQQLAHQYMLEIDALQAAANMPFALAGTDGKGVSQVNDMSYVLLNAYAATKLSETKLHILCNPDMPRDFLQICMQCVKDGGNSLVFINNQQMVDGLVKLGIDRDDAAAYAIVGCYESSAREEIPCSCNARMSLPKALEVTLHGGKDAISGDLIGVEAPVAFESYEELMAGLFANIAHFAKGAMAITNEYESRYAQIHASPFFSSCMASCVEKGADAYADYGAAYNNSSINIIGMGTLVDSLYTIRKLVYEDKRLTLQQFIEILDTNWEGQELLRGIIRNKLPKYGVGNKDVDAIATRVFNHLSDCINNVPNVKGGVYRLGILSIDWRKAWGEHTAASADGRKQGETLSQNASATFGMDKEGPTGHILSVASMDGTDAVNGLVLDIDLHSSAVRGENGTNVLIATLETMLQAGGQTVHYNILDTDTLRDAQEHPEKYPNLQVRMCGWNVLFTHLSRKSQDEFIHRSEMLAG